MELKQLWQDDSLSDANDDLNESRYVKNTQKRTSQATTIDIKWIKVFNRPRQVALIVLCGNDTRVLQVWSVFSNTVENNNNNNNNNNNKQICIVP